MLEQAILEHAKALNNLADAIRGQSGKLAVPVYGPAVDPKEVKPAPEKTVVVSKPAPEQKVEAPKVEEKDEAAPAPAPKAEEKAEAPDVQDEQLKEVEKVEAAPVAEQHPTVEDVIAVFSAYLPKDLDAEERKARHAFVKPMLAKFGADKATNLKPEHRAEAIEIIKKKMAEG